MNMIWPFNNTSKKKLPPESDPPLDLNTPVTNPVLKAALKNYQQLQSPQNEDSLFHALTSANYLVTIITDEMKTVPGEKPGQVTIQEGSLIKFMSCFNAANACLLPAFTDWDEIRSWTKESVSTLVMPCDQLWDFVIRDQRYHGLVINPSGHAWEMSTVIIKELKNRITQHAPPEGRGEAPRP